jgi:hypothetical protein
MTLAISAPATHHNAGAARGPSDPETTAPKTRVRNARAESARAQ